MLAGGNVDEIDAVDLALVRSVVAGMAKAKGER